MQVYPDSDPRTQAMYSICTAVLGAAVFYLPDMVDDVPDEAANDIGGWPRNEMVSNYAWIFFLSWSMATHF